MRITDIRTMLLSGPDPHGVGGGFRTWTMLLVRVDTDEGIYGLGEAGDMLGTREAIGWIRRRLIGRDPLAVRPIVSELLYGGMPPHDEEMSITATPTGPIVWGASGVEMALCDLAGKALGTPVYNLLGGAFRDRVRIYLDRSSPADPTDLDAWPHSEPMRSRRGSSTSSSTPSRQRPSTPPTASRARSRRAT